MRWCPLPVYVKECGGGIAPESALDYYRIAIELWHDRTSGASHPGLLVDSLDGGHLFELGHRGGWEDVGEAIADSLFRLGTAGAGMALIASNTAPLAHDALAPTAIPFIHIADPTAARSATSLLLEMVQVLAQLPTRDPLHEPVELVLLDRL